MEQDQIRAKLEEITKNLRQQAKEMDEAIATSRALKYQDLEEQMRRVEEAEARLSYYKQILSQMISKQWAEKQRRRGIERKAPEDRVFAQASTSEEAEGTIPTIEERIFALNGKTRRETFEHGTLTEKIRAYLCFKDDSNYLGGETNLTEREWQQITLSIETPEDSERANRYMREFDRLCRCGEQLSYYFKRFQAMFSPLARLLNLWDMWDEKAQHYTAEIRKLQEIPIFGEEPTGKRTGATLRFGSKEMKEKAIERAIKHYESMKIDGVKLEYNRTKNSIFANVFYQGGLYDKILQEAKEAETAMGDFNAIAFAAEEAINKSELHYTPISIEIPIENAKTERYTRYLVKNLRYFRSELKRSHTSEDRKRALIPDYYEAKPNKVLYRAARADLNK